MALAGAASGGTGFPTKAADARYSTDVYASEDQATSLLSLLPTRRVSSLTSEVANYVEAIMSTGDRPLIQLKCVEPNLTRYGYLRSYLPQDVDRKPRYLFALDLYQSAKVLPRLLSSIVQAIRFLGPNICVLSITEGRSTDGTFEILASLRSKMSDLGVTYFLHESDLNPLREGTDRVETLAELQNLALSLLTNNPEDFHPDTTVIFINDVSLCTEDVLELLHQQIYQSAHVMCSMDRIASGQLFYNVWISRIMSGDTFFEIPQDGSWEYSKTCSGTILS